MKKIFTILGTMIIIGNSVSTVIIINSDKNEQVKNLKNSKINFEKNKLEKPNLIKRQITPLPLYWHSNPGPSRINISNVIASVNLGILSNNDQATILERISEQNPNLDTTQIQINFTRFNEDGTQLWTISVRENSQMYFGEQNVRFSIRSNLCDFLSQQNLANVLLIPLCTVIKNTNLGVLPNEDQTTILARLANLNPNLDITQVVAHFIRIDDNGTFIWIIAPSENSIYTSVIQVYFRINPTLMINHIQIPEININVEKQKKLNKINFEPLSENEKRSFKETLQRIGTAAIRAGIIPDKAKITANVMPPVNANHELGAKEIITSSLIFTAGLAAVSKTTGLSPINGLKTIANYFRYNLVSPPLETTAKTAQVAELAPLLSSGETAMLTTAGEEAIIGAETTVSATLAPETLGLSVLIGLIIVGTTSLIWWLNDSSSQLIRNKPHSQYNEIEKYYKVFHDQLKIGINLSKWKKISQIYYQYYNNYQKFSHMVKKEIIDFYREDHSGWGGSINENDIDILIKALFNNFNEINNKFVVNSVGGWKIVTDTNGSYFLMK